MKPFDLIPLQSVIREEISKIPATFSLKTPYLQCPPPVLHVYASSLPSSSSPAGPEWVSFCASCPFLRGSVNVRMLAPSKWREESSEPAPIAFFLSLPLSIHLRPPSLLSPLFCTLQQVHGQHCEWGTDSLPMAKYIKLLKHVFIKIQINPKFFQHPFFKL